ncbi:sciellin isoform X11 [Amia ocellicauda]|uniref:sciellin isoform X11 n=1 Tax=Amia ocellicauda TaxID=2972642 RepID=UPI0034646A6B
MSYAYPKKTNTPKTDTRSNAQIVEDNRKKTNLLKDNSWIKKNVEEDEPIDKDENFGKSLLSRSKTEDTVDRNTDTNTSNSSNQVSSVKNLTKRFGVGGDQTSQINSRGTDSFKRQSWTGSHEKPTSPTKSSSTTIKTDPKTTTFSNTVKNTVVEQAKTSTPAKGTQDVKTTIITTEKQTPIRKVVPVSTNKTARLIDKFSSLERLNKRDYDFIKTDSLKSPTSADYDFMKSASLKSPTSRTTTSYKTYTSTEDLPSTITTKVYSSSENLPSTRTSKVYTSTEDLPSTITTKTYSSSENLPSTRTSKVYTSTEDLPSTITTKVYSSSDNLPSTRTSKVYTSTENLPSTITTKVYSSSDNLPSTRTSKVYTSTENLPSTITTKTYSSSENLPSTRTSKIYTSTEDLPSTITTKTYSSSENLPSTRTSKVYTSTENLPSTRTSKLYSSTEDLISTRSYSRNSEPSYDYTDSSSRSKSYSSKMSDSSYDFTSDSGPQIYTKTSYLESSNPQDYYEGSISSKSIHTVYSTSDRTIIDKDMCTYCRKPINTEAKMILDDLHICCHASCFKCEVCNSPLGNLKAGDSMWIYRRSVHCENCFGIARDKWHR